MKSFITPQEAISLLNEALTLDYDAVYSLFENRVLANDKLADHPTIQVSNGPVASLVGILGLLNGMFGTFTSGSKQGFGPITANYDNTTHRLLSFSLTEND